MKFLLETNAVLFETALFFSKIILFGFFTKGTEKEDSDLDICVITDQNKRKNDMLKEIRLSTIGKIDIQMDIVMAARSFV